MNKLLLLSEIMTTIKTFPDYSSLKFMLIDQHHSEILKSENFWIGMLLTNRKGLNGSHDFAQQ